MLVTKRENNTYRKQVPNSITYMKLSLSQNRPTVKN